MQILLCLQTFIILLVFGENCPIKPLHKIGLNVQCYIGDKTNSVSCLNPIQVDTKANITCKYGYQNSRNIENQEITCQSNSQWSEEPMNCEDVCVDNTDSVTALFVNNQIENTLTQAPWHVSILVTRDNVRQDISAFTCDGVILNAKIVLTNNGVCIKYFSADELEVSVAKFKKAINARELYSQTSQVKEIYLNTNFNNHEASQVVILELIQPFEYNLFVRPACLDWPSITDEAFNSDSVGFTVQWNDFANCVNDRNATYIELNTREFKEFYRKEKCSADGRGYRPPQEFDRFCYKIYTDQEHLCSPKQGAGIMLKKESENSISKRCLWGLSLYAYKEARRSGSTKNVHTVVFFNIWHQKDFIDKYTEKFKSSNVYNYQFTNQACPTVNFKRKHLIATCKYDDKPISCDDHIKPGTTVHIKCEREYQPTIVNKPDEIKCMEEGLWSDEFYQCELICGKIENVPKKQTLVPLSLGGVETDIVNVPWQIAIYSNNTSKNQRKWTLICGGTLIHSNIVLSAAHCFWDPSINVAFDPFYYLIGSGKRYRDYDASETDAQFSRILQIRIPTTFVLTSLRNDVAVLVLEKKLIFSAYTKPACLEWSSYGNYDYQSGITGLVAGFGSTSQYSDTSRELRLIKIPTIDALTCQHLVDPDYKDIITGENFCAQGSKGETACSGDSGGGFLIPKYDENGIERYYLIGIVSAGADPAKHCTEHFISTYTNVQYHQDIIKVTAANNTEI